MEVETMLNHVNLIGNLTRDPELRYTQSGVAVTRFTLAVSRDYKNQAGEREADFIPCVIWRSSAERFAEWFKKGSRVSVTGRLQSGKYETEDGETRYTLDLNVDKFYNLNLERSNAHHDNEPIIINEEDIPF
jgi:single-strand DNA-binding protein